MRDIALSNPQNLSDAEADAPRMNRRQAAKVRTRQKVLDAARGLFAERGYEPATIRDIAKGAGMICPNMATMLAFLATDARISRSLLCRLFQEAVDDSFNLITVDGDTSTNDTAIILANGTAPGVEISEGTPASRARVMLMAGRSSGRPSRLFRSVSVTNSSSSLPT